MKEYLQKNKSIFITISVLLFITSSWALKSIYFINQIQLSPHKKFILISSFGFSLILISFMTGRKRPGVRWLPTFIIYLFFTGLFYSDILYERYYDAILSIDLLGQANQIDDVTDSIVSLIYKTDFWYWVDIPFILFALLWLSLSYKKQPLRINYIPAITLLTGVLIIMFTTFYPLKTSYSDQYKVALSGIIPTHIFDITNSVRAQIQRKEISEDEKELIVEWKEKFENAQEIQKNSAFFGKYKGSNVIIVQAESLNTFPIGLNINGEAITPTIDELVKSSYYYPNTYLQIGRGNTSDAEFVTNNSIHPIASKGMYKTYPNNDYLSLSNVLNKRGYQTSATHGNTGDFWNRNQAYIKQGFDTFYSKDHLKIKSDEIIGLGISDESIFNQMTDIYSENQQPFYNFIISLTNHRPFELPTKYQYLDLPEEFSNTVTGNYLQSVRYFDNALGKFISQLKKNGTWDDTIFVMYGDHYGPIPKDKDEINTLLDVDFNEKTQFQIPLLIHVPEQTEGITNEIITSQMDIYPTITTLLGIDQPLVQIGESLTDKKEGFVGYAYETTRYSFYSDDYDYIASHTGVFEEGTCKNPITNEIVNIESCRKGYDRVFEEINTSKLLIELNQLNNITK